MSKAASCLACCPVSQQKVSRTGVAMIGCEVIASFHLDAKMGPATYFSQNITKGVVSCHNITPTLTSDGMMSKGVKGLVRAKSALGSLGCVHTKPPLYGPMHQDVDPAPVMVGQTARRMHVVQKLKAIVLCQPWRRFPYVYVVWNKIIIYINIKKILIHTCIHVHTHVHTPQ